MARCRCVSEPKPRFLSAELVTATATIGTVDIVLGILGGILHWTAVVHVSATGVVGNWRAYFARVFLVNATGTNLSGGNVTQAAFGTASAIPLVPLTRMDARNTAGHWNGPSTLPEGDWTVVTLVRNDTGGNIATRTLVSFSPFKEREG